MCSRLFAAASENEARSLCNHRRAYKFFTDSVSPRCHFPAAPCDSYESFLQGRCFPCDPPSRPCGNMGYYADRALARGALYLVTRDEEPFCGESCRRAVCCAWRVSGGREYSQVDLQPTSTTCAWRARPASCQS